MANLHPTCRVGVSMYHTHPVPPGRCKRGWDQREYAGYQMAQSFKWHAYSKEVLLHPRRPKLQNPFFRHLMMTITTSLQPC